MVDAAHEPMRALLVAERDRVRDQLSQLGHDGATDSFDEGFADSGQVTAERSEVEALVATLVDALEDVEHALAKLDGGSYGTCEECGGPIPAARLEAMPAARACMDCASKRR